MALRKNIPAFFVQHAHYATGALLGVLLIAIAGFAAPKARAYALEPLPPAANPGAAIGQGYNFSNSFQNLISSFTAFFDNMKNTNGTVSITGGSAGGSGIPNGVTVTVDWRSYVQRFDVWFYNATGVQIQWLTTFIVNIFAWIVGTLQGIATWVAGIVTKSL